MTASYSRTTHAWDGDLVVFHIGMVFRKPHRPDLWLPVFTAMPRMLAELERNKAAAARGEAEDLGFLGATTLLGAKGPTVIQWWRSVEDVYAYANAGGLRHRPAWLEFHRAAKADPDAVTIWHETYAVPPGGVEIIYAGPRPFGLGTLAGTVPVGRRGETARERMGRPGPA